MSRKLLLLALVAFMCLPFSIMATPVPIAELEPYHIDLASTQIQVSNNNQRLDITTFPWTEDFEGTTFLPTDWTELNFALPNTITQGTENHTTGGSHGVTFDTSQQITDPNGMYTQLIFTPAVQLTGLNNPFVEFWAKRNNAAINEVFIVGLGTDPTDLSTFQFLNASSIIGQDTNWQELVLDLGGFTGTWYFACGVNNSTSQGGTVSIDDFKVHDGAVVYGTVSLDGAGDVTQVDVTLGNETVNPDTSGVYVIADNADISGDLTATLPGYAPWSQTGVTASLGSMTNVDISMTALTGRVVDGFIDGSDNPGAALVGAVATLSNNIYSFSDTTETAGTYQLINVPDGNYSLRVSALGYSAYTQDVVVDANETFNATLTENIVAPSSVTAELQGNDVNVTWVADVEEFSYDTGVVNGQLGFDPGTANSVMGTLYRESADLTSVSWYLTDEGGPHSNIELVIYGYNVNANRPDESNVLYSSGSIANVDMQWNTHDLPSTISAQNGFYVGIKFPNGFMGLALDDVAAANATPHTQYVCYDTTDPDGQNGWVDLTGQIDQHFLVRAYGTRTGSRMENSICPVTSTNISNLNYIPLRHSIVTNPPQIVANERAFLGYNVFRFESADMDNPANWTVLATDVSGESYLDNTWSSVTDGLYYYGVCGNYTSGTSDTSLTSVPLATSIVVSGTVDGNDNPGTPISGLTVNLTNEDVDFSTVTDASGMFTFDNAVSNSEYTMTIMADGYEYYSYTFTPTTDTTLTITLTEDLAPPMIVTAEENAGDAVVTWSYTGDEIALDSGVVDAQLGTSAPGPNTALGTAFLRNADISEVSWYLTAEGAPHEQVSVVIMALDDAGVPDVSNILYTSDPIDNIDVQWNTHRLPAVLRCETGFYVGIVYSEGFIGMATDDHDQTNYTPNSQWVFNDYTDQDSGFTLDNMGTPNYSHFLVRARGIDNGPVTPAREMSANSESFEGISCIENRIPMNVGSPEYSADLTRSLVDYTVYRFAEADYDNMANWTTLSDNETGTSYTDTDFGTLTTGVYYYAVAAEYTTGTSNPKISPLIGVNMGVKVLVEVFSDTGDPVVGAEVMMNETNGNKTYSGTISSGTSVLFENVWRSNYDVAVDFEGYKIDTEIVNYDCTGDSTYIAAMIVEQFEQLSSLTYTMDETSVTLTWTGAIETVLLVDDDGSAWNTQFTDTAPLYQTIMDDLEIDLTILETTSAAQDGPALAELQGYDIVIWECGSNYTGSSSLTDNDHAYLATFIENGGKLILNAPEYLYDRFNGMGTFSAGDFPFDYLGVQSATQDAFTPTAATPLVGSTGSYVSGMLVNQNINLGLQDMDQLVPNANGIAFAEILSTQSVVVGIQTANTIFFAGSLTGLEDGTTDTANDFIRQAMTGLANSVAPTRSFQGYTVERNNVVLAEGIMEMTYRDSLPLDGEAEYKVYGVYTNGNSNEVTVTVTFDDVDENVNNYTNEVYGNYPNPFNPTTEIAFSIAKESNVVIDIYNIKGQKVKTLLNEKCSAGKNTIVWHGKDSKDKSVGSGVYFYRIKTPAFTKTNKMIMLK